MLIRERDDSRSDAAKNDGVKEEMSMPKKE